MAKARFATIKDKTDFRRIWDKCFTDSDVFSTWLFDTRFVPEYSVCLEEDGKIVSTIQSLPVHIYMRGKTIPSAIVMGVSTDPEYGGRGFMKKLLTFYLNNITPKDVILVPYTPVKIDTYYFSGAYPVADVSFMEGETDVKNRPAEVELVSPKECMGELYSLYKAFYKNYSGIVARSYSDFVLKSEDYTVDGGFVAIYRKNGKALGYTFFYNMEDTVYGEETVWITDEAKDKLIKFISSFAENKKYKIKLPADKNPIPRSVLNITSIDALLKLLDINCTSVIEVKDNLNEANNGCFCLKTGKTDASAHASMDIGSFAQLISGYKTLYELIFDGKATIYNKDEADKINEALPKLDTFIFDDY